MRGPRTRSRSPSGQLELCGMKGGQLDAFLEAVEEWPAVSWKGTRSWSLGLPGPLGRVWGGSETRKQWGTLPACTERLCLGFLSSVQRAHPTDPSCQQSDQDPLPHREEEPGMPSQQRPSPTALLAHAAALPLQVGGPCLGSHATGGGAGRAGAGPRDYWVGPEGQGQSLRTGRGGAGPSSPH